MQVRFPNLIIEKILSYMVLEEPKNIEGLQKFGWRLKVYQKYTNHFLENKNYNRSVEFIYRFKNWILNKFETVSALYQILKKYDTAFLNCKISMHHLSLPKSVFVKQMQLILCQALRLELREIQDEGLTENGPLQVVKNIKKYNNNIETILVICPEALNCTVFYESYFAPPLFIACLNSAASPDTIKLLIEYKADPNPYLSDKKGVERKRLWQVLEQQLVLAFDNRNVIEILKESSKNMNTKDDEFLSKCQIFN